ncbi:transposase [Rickettsia endosymbiont of Ixodes scapularis]|uniref:Transposase DDE domain-containing protein n=1 Tax=Rickettsia tamurae subsp. buchneri TaxID=1462938 RepID=A0A8E0WM59_9RICK|nr:ISPg3, transposase [Rickettsia endosymbiont of Ixodes scapularis]KDO03208.1 hypothetical protein REISMN_02995 [Rickettsia tamurae subsp. buchneri]
MKKDITALFCFVDDFCKVAEYWISRSFLPISNKKPTRESKISHSEKNKLIPLIEKFLLRKRSIIETVFSVLKGSFELEHTRHRSIWNAFVHILSTLVAYCMKSNKPAISKNYLIQN